MAQVVGTGRQQPKMDSRLWRQGRLGKAGQESQIIFAQVREESAVELELLAARPTGETVFCIASGGCTALSLLLANPSQVQMVDVNPAQIHLVELKLAALRRLSEGQCKIALLRDATPSYPLLRMFLSLEAQRFWGGNMRLLALGLNQCGLIEQRLRQLMRLLPLVQSRRNIRRLFHSKDMKQQREIYLARWNHWRWRLAFKMVLSKPVLKLVYGDEFVAAIPPNFAKVMKQRLDETFLEHPLIENGYLWQLFHGCYPFAEASLPLYLQHQNLPLVRAGLPQVRLACDDAAQWLENQPSSSIGFFAFSNILEVSSLDYTVRLLYAVAHAAKPGATVCLRSIFPPNQARLQQAAGAAKLRYNQVESAALEVKDRSFFCTNLQVLEICKE